MQGICWTLSCMHTQDLDVSAIPPVKAAQLVAVNASVEGPWTSAVSLPELEESNKKHTINGLLFCNLPGLNMSMGDTYVVQDKHSCIKQLHCLKLH